MAEQIKVIVFRFGDRKFLHMQYTDPLTGRKKTRSTKTADKRQAERVAAKWEAELREGRYCEPLKITWQEFRERCEREVVNGLATETDHKIHYIFNTLERFISPLRLRDVTAERLSHFQAKLREKKLSENSIKSYLAHVGAALRWAVRIGLLPKAPTIEMPRRAKATKMMKDRPITREEFERMLDAVPKVLASRTRGKKPLLPDAAAVESWQHFLEGLWCSGLRLEESLELWWDRDDKLAVDLSGEFPMLRIPAELEKGHKDRLLPIAPEFAEFLLKAPETERSGRVFNPRALRKHSVTGVAGWKHVSRIICKIGKKAGVKVDTDARKGTVKYASAHDLRRSFGERWAVRIMPQVLMELMRHEDIQTTMKYYVGRNAERTASVLWEAHQKAALANTLANSGQNDAMPQEAETSATTSRN